MKFTFSKHDLKLDIGIADPPFGLPLIAFCKRALHIRIYTHVCMSIQLTCIHVPHRIGVEQKGSQFVERDLNLHGCHSQSDVLHYLDSILNRSAEVCLYIWHFAYLLSSTYHHPHLPAAKSLRAEIAGFEAQLYIIINRKLASVIAIWIFTP